MVVINYAKIPQSSLSLGDEDNLGDGYLIPVKFNNDSLIVGITKRYYTCSENNFKKKEVSLILGPEDEFSSNYNTVIDLVANAIKEGKYNHLIKDLDERFDSISKLRRIENRWFNARVTPMTGYFDANDELKKDIPKSGNAIFGFCIKSVFISATTVSIQTQVFQMAEIDKRVTMLSLDKKLLKA